MPSDIKVEENKIAGTSVLYLDVVDDDRGEAGRFNCEIDTSNTGYLYNIFDYMYAFYNITYML